MHSNRHAIITVSLALLALGFSVLASNHALTFKPDHSRGADHGQDGHTYAHPILAAAYGGFLSPKLEIEVREIWLRYRKADAALADEILQRASAEDNKRVAIRAMSRVRRVRYTDTLQDHGVKGFGYAKCTNEIYLQLLNGTAGRIRAQRNLAKKANIRDHLETDELSFVMAAESLASGRIEEEQRFGNNDCAEASGRSAGFIREAIERDKKDRQPRLIC
jgi:hypothetical protein